MFSLLVLSSSFLSLRQANAIPGSTVLAPPNIWRPFGPAPSTSTSGGTGVGHLQFQYYADPAAEFSDFAAGHLDLTDSPQPRASFGAYDFSPDFTISPIQGGNGLIGVFFNGASTTWSAWGCNWGDGAGHTYTSTCGIEMRQAFAHLINRGDIATNNVFNPSVPVADPTDAEQTDGLQTTPFAMQCTWDQSVMVKFGTACYNHWGGNQPGAYTITGSGGPCLPTPLGVGPAQLYQNCPAGGGFPQPGTPDFCAAAIHMIYAGIAVGMDPNCVLLGINPGVFAHPLRFLVDARQPKRNLNGLSAEFNALFGGAVVATHIGPFASESPIVFYDTPGQVDDWDAYTYAYGLPLAFGGQALFNMFSSQFSSRAGPCVGATGGSAPSNPTFMCNPTLDSLLATQSTSPTIPAYMSNTLAVFNYYGEIAGDIPVVSPGIRVAALTSVGGLVNAESLSYTSGNLGGELEFAQTNRYTPMNAYCNGYVPANPIYSCGGGNQKTLRFGISEPTSHLNIFNAQTVSEFQTIGEIYDTLFSASPINPKQPFCWMCNSEITSVDTSGNTHFNLRLRQDLRWQDDACTSSLIPLAVLSSDSLIRFVDTSGNGKWDQGETVVYAKPSFVTFGVGDTVISGIAPALGTALTTDPLIKFYDADFNGFWDPGEPVVYDPGNTGIYNPGSDIVITQCLSGVIDAYDVAFSLLALRDLAPLAGNGLKGHLKSISVLGSHNLEIVFNGQSILYPEDLETFIIPRHIWECDFTPDCGASDLLVTAAGGSLADYSNAGVFSPSASKVSPDFDPSVNNALIGSGPFECKSMFASDLGKIGTGCIQNADGSRGGQAIPVGGVALLTAYDNTGSGTTDPFNQYMRSFNPDWATGTGTAAQSGQYQEFNYSDKNQDGTVGLTDLASVAACFDAKAPTATCSLASYNYWQRNSFELTLGTITGEVSIVAAHYGDTCIYPYPKGTLTNIAGC